MASAILHSASNPVRNASSRRAPESPRASATASPAASGGTVGCVRSPKTRSGAFESCVSS